MSSSPSCPSWYISPEKQVLVAKRIRQSWDYVYNDIPIPMVPEPFPPLTSTEVLMLNVVVPRFGYRASLKDTFNELWDMISIRGADKYSPNNILMTRLSFKDSLAEKPGFYWLAFDIDASNRGLSPYKASKIAWKHQKFLAGTSVLMAMVLFPKWAETWDGKKSPFPIMGGLDYCSGHTLAVKLWQQRQLYIQVYSNEKMDHRYFSPTIREIC